MEGVKSKEIGTVLDRWWKVIAVVFTAVSTCFGAYYMLLSHEGRLNKKDAEIIMIQEKHEKDILNLQESYKRQYSVIEEKSNQKFDQGMKVALELKSRIEKVEDRVNTEESKTAYTIGWREAEKFYRNK